MNDLENMVHIRLSKYHYDSINEIAKKLGFTKTDVIRYAINDLIKEILTEEERNKLTLKFK